jgi:hypothetical protein
MTRAGDDAKRSDEVGVPPSREAARGRAALMTCAGDDAERSDEEERRS